MSIPRLPVVACTIGQYADQGPVRVFDASTYRADLPAVALPWALLEDAEFRRAIRRRLWASPSSCSNVVAIGHALDFITAELRARAGGGE